MRSRMTVLPKGFSTERNPNCALGQYKSLECRKHARKHVCYDSQPGYFLPHWLLAPAPDPGCALNRVGRPAQGRGGTRIWLLGSILTWAQPALHEPLGIAPVIFLV